jgi:HlyD family secretion protein
MNMRRARPFVVAAVLVLAVAAYVLASRPGQMVLTGIVTTNDVLVSPLVSGRIERMLVQEGDSVQKGQLLAVIAPDELEADRAYYAHSAAASASGVQESEAALRFQELQTSEEIRQAQANLAAATAARDQGAADLDSARVTFERNSKLHGDGVVASQDLDLSRAAFEAARAHVASLEKQVDAQRAALALARSNADQVAMRRSQLQASRQQRDAAAAQQTKADVRLAYAELHAPLAGIVDVRVARLGEVVNAGQPVVSLIDPDGLWVRADVEETYIDRVRIGDRLTVRLPSGVEREGSVTFRGIDAGFATQRDVSRTKRDIKTFELRLRVDNQDRRLAVGMTAYVLLPLGR